VVQIQHPVNWKLDRFVHSQRKGLILLARLLR
jgi:hypothetical protein